MMDILFLVLPETLLLDLVGPAEAFRLANQQLQARGRPPAFALRYVCAQPQASTSIGLHLTDLEPLPDALPPGAWVVLMGRPGVKDTLPMLQRNGWMGARHWLARVVAPALALETPDGEPAHRLLTVCCGTLLAADAGLIGRRQVTTHHEHLDTLAALAPQAQVCANRVFVIDGPVWSSAGITAGIDLALHCIGDVCGDAIAAAVAEIMVVFQRRGADDPQRSPLLDGRNHLHPAVHRVQNAVCERPGHDWDVPALAEVAHVTPRHLARLFKDHAGISPRDYVERIRSGLAEQAIARGLPTSQAVEIAGFGTDRQFRRARARLRGAAA
ncbi:GlxA family transcriptional regulator [Scleromatobacter humisilvae]|uniref:Helix-turn-helix domain-containing protein n=1 Tax=Scleromatobacter humisilvae TaxID=2897159 RepID=A0A9X1YMF0_9BURK|nr:helix-turn-helix domain-containing protein [Scleromatobacter humisilvae]MCK9688964.1 helix-turn-helix domain-containing protein [Scleromatobacter humisilvae]